MLLLSAATVGLGGGGGGGSGSGYATTTTTTSLNFVVYATTIIIVAGAVSFTQAAARCEFKKDWTGSWFLSGVPNLIHINATHIESKGECYEEQGDKYLVYDKLDDCYRCMVIHNKHSSVLQYKETYCDVKRSLDELCYTITGDAPLYSMFRKHPEAKPVPCPFKSAPFTFSYSRGSGDCTYPPSKAESCTDDSRLVLKYQACPDIPSTESFVEELVCIATWKEGSIRYLIGKLHQGNRRNSLITDEDQYRCFIYQRDTSNGRVIYHIAQSGDATCTGLQNAFEGSRTMKLTTVENHHYKCKFPIWITEHHTWLSLDHHKTYKFSQKNATLKILDDEQLQQPSKKMHQNNVGTVPLAAASAGQTYGFQEFGFESQDQRKVLNTETRLVCHTILAAEEHKRVQIVAHVTAGCDSGYVCMTFYKRDSNVIELQQTETPVENPDDACSNFNPSETPFTTLITTTLHPKQCPHLGRFTVHGAERRRKKRQNEPQNELQHFEQQQPSADCLGHNYEAVSVGCGPDGDSMEFRSACAQQTLSEYVCHGSWQDEVAGVSYVITSPKARKSTDALRYCFIYTTGEPRGPIVDGGKHNGAVEVVQQQQPILRLSGVSESCHRHIVPGVNGNWAFNFTMNGTCSMDNENKTNILVPTSILFVLSSVLFAMVLR